eukprot:CAMPEP_0198129724 /NCGR_PEP_ID=MMETSP1442-20131203/52384_1 /TAXON_ID= /ORGANISM="Craspedostauros australis, Strain CCMP3328" /LENGTH=225 /DNA_ID=CAMNT_0043790175 /DNA_START=45 /DNA_END=722 /DNA_ORIENTATION=-
MKITPTSNLVFRYISLPHGLGGRGGVQRFFMLANEIPFSEDLYGAKWPEAKKAMVESGENPCGSAPVIYCKDDDSVHLSQAIAGSKYIGAVFGATTGDAYGDYVQDLVCDEYQGFRDLWVAMAFASGDDAEDKKKAYREESLPKQLTKFDALYGKFKTHDVYLSVSKKTNMPLWGDAALFGLIRDNVITGFMKMDDLDKYPNLASMYKSYAKIGPVAAWIEKVAA